MPKRAALPTDRSFGITFTVVFALIAAWLYWTDRSGVVVLASLSVLTLVVSFACPSILHPLNRLWMKFAEILHKIVNPIVLGAMYYVVIAPVGIGMRLFGRDALRRRIEPEASSYWVDRKPPGPPPDSLPNQF